MEVNPDRILRTGPSNDRLGGCQEENVVVATVLDDDERIRTDGQEALDLAVVDGSRLVVTAVAVPAAVLDHDPPGQGASQAGGVGTEARTQLVFLLAEQICGRA